MRGSTRKRGKTWTAYWDGPVTADPETGAIRRSQKSKGGFRTQKEAQAFLQDVLPKVASGLYVEPTSQPLAAFMYEWLKVVEANDEIRSTTAYRYGRIIRTYIASRPIGQVPLSRLSPDMLVSLYAELQKCSNPECKHANPETCKGLSGRSRQLIHAVVRRSLNDAVRWERIARNPVAQVRSPRPGEKRVQAWTDRELVRFLTRVQYDRLFALWRLAATTGMRRGELLGLQWIDLDVDAKELKVERQLRPTEGGPTLGPPKSKNGFRTIALDQETLDALMVHRDRQLAEQALAGDAYKQHDFIFCNELGGPISPTRLGERFVEHRKAAGIPVGTLHVLRHTAATLALTAGMPLHIVAARLGDDSKTILSTYAHVLPRSDVRVAESIAATIAAAAIVDKPLTESAAGR